MDLNKLVPSRDWVNLINENFEKLDKESEIVDVVIGDGWSLLPEKGSLAKVKVLPLSNGSTLKILYLDIHTSNLRANTAYNLATVPEEASVNRALLVGNSVSTNVAGHFQGTLHFSGINGHQIGCYYEPMDGQPGPFDVTLHTALLYE